MDTKVRNIIKNAYKNLSVVENLDVDTLIKMVESTFDKQHRKLPMGKDCIRKIYLLQSNQQNFLQSYCMEN